MLILALETSTAQGSVCVFSKKDGVVAQKVWMRENSHSELITPAIEAVLENANMGLKDVDAFAVSQGPGSFTGIRVGLSAVKTLAYSTNKPVYTFNSLELLAAAAHSQKPNESRVASLIKAHKNQCYMATFDVVAGTLKCIEPPQAVTLEVLETKISQPHLCVGDGYDFFKDRFSQECLSFLSRSSQCSDYPAARTIADLMTPSQNSPQPKSWNELEPLYIRQSEAEEKLRSGTLKPLPEY